MGPEPGGITEGFGLMDPAAGRNGGEVGDVGPLGPEPSALLHEFTHPSTPEVGRLVTPDRRGSHENELVHGDIAGHVLAAGALQRSTAATVSCIRPEPTVPTPLGKLDRVGAVVKDEHPTVGPCSRQRLTELVPRLLGACGVDAETFLSAFEAATAD